MSLYAFHVLFTGGLFYGILLFGRAFFIHDNELYRLILLIGLGKLMVFLSAPLKQVSSGLERFKLLAYMLVMSNMARGTSLLILAFLHQVNIGTIIWVFIGGDVLELMVSFYLFRRYVVVPVLPAWKKAAYFSLLRESLPQVGVVLITSALARFDWLFIGFMVSAASLAEYSFAYKIFEISTLPLLAIAPLIIPRFTRLFKTDNHRQADFKLLIRIELIIAGFTGLMLNMCWNPVVDSITHGRYGAVNTITIFILSLCLPFMYLNNFLWTIFFAQNKLKMIFQSFLVTFGVNVAADLVLIPLYKNEGAALAFLLACLVQVIFYLANDSVGLKGSFYKLIICTACAFFSGLAAKMLFQNPWPAGIISVIFYGLSLLITMQLKRTDKEGLTRLINW
jgi:O-antigen/teichoic acid export membrane protein